MKTALLIAVLSLPVWTRCERCAGTGVAWFVGPAPWGWLPTCCPCRRCGTMGIEYRRPTSKGDGA